MSFVHHPCALPQGCREIVAAAAAFRRLEPAGALQRALPGPGEARGGRAKSGWERMSFTRMSDKSLDAHLVDPNCILVLACFPRLQASQPPVLLDNSPGWLAITLARLKPSHSHLREFAASCACSFLLLRYLRRAR